MSRFPRGGRRRARREGRRHGGEDGVLVDPAAAAGRERDERRHQPRVPHQRRLCVVVVRSAVGEAVEPVRPSDHGAGDNIGVRRAGIAPLPAAGAGIIPAGAWNRRTAVVHVARVLGAVADHVAHLPRVLPQDVVNLQRGGGGDKAVQKPLTLQCAEESPVGST